MSNSTDKTPLLPKENNLTNAGKIRKSRVFICIGLVMIVFKGSEEIALSCFKQYIYFWCKQYLNASTSVSANASIPDQDSGEAAECGEDEQSETAEDDAQSLASQWLMYFEILSAVLVFFSTAFYGTLSDYVGRKIIGCLSLFGTASRCIVYAVVVYFDLHIAYCLFAYTIDGLCGSFTTFSLFAYTSCADVTTSVRERVFGVAVIEALFGLGFLTTDIATGYYIQRYGYFYPMFTGACGTIFGLVLAIAILKETKSTTEAISTTTNTKTTCPKMQTFRTLLKNLTSFYLSKEQKNKRIFWLALGVFFLVEFVLYGKSSPLTLYQLGRPFCWTSEMIGWYGGAYLVATYIIGIIALKPLLCVVSEHVAACAGIVSLIALNVITALAKSTLDLFIGICAGFLSVLPKSIVRGMVSSRVSGQKQGAIFAGLQSSELVCKLIAGPAALTVYSHTLDTMRGSVFLVLAGISGITLLLQIWMAVLLRKEKRKTEPTIVVVSPEIQQT